MWFEGYSKEREWDLLLEPLVSQEGSKILITSRRDTFPTALCCGEVVRLEDLKDAEFFWHSSNIMLSLERKLEISS
jgi:hypothetical protein